MVLASWAIPAIAFSDIRDFIPRIYDRHADLEIDAGAYRQEFEAHGRGSTSTDIFSVEKIRLFVDGYSFHPRFVQFFLNLAVGIRQENFSSTSEPSSFNTGFAKDYDIKILILPTHPYRLQLFTRHGEPLPRLTRGISQFAVTDTSGGIFTYKQKPYFVIARVIRESVEFQGQTNSVMTYDLNARYRKEYKQGRSFSLWGEFSHTDGTSFLGTETSNYNYLLGNNIDLGRYGIGTSLQYGTSSQPPSSSNTFSWGETFSAKLPWNFESGLSLSYIKAELKSGEGAQEDDAANSSRGFDFHITHRLYESLTSGYTMNYRKQDSSDTRLNSASDGTSTSLGNSLAVNYVKKIPLGTLLTGVSLSRATSETNGSLRAINEAHPSVEVPGSFPLNGRDVDRESIRVQLKSPQSPFELITLIENIHYVVAPVGDTFQITVVGLPAPFIIPGSFDFVVSYSSIFQNSKIESTGLNYQLSLRLFHDMIIPYYYLNIQRQKVLAGPLEPTDSTINTYGLIINKAPFHLMGEYSVTDSTLNPSKTWRGEASYTSNIASATYLNAYLHYSRTEYGQGDSGEGTSRSVLPTQTIAGGGFNFRQRFRDKNMYLGLGGSYVRSMSTIVSEAYSANSEFQWFIGKIIMRLGANLTRLSDNSVAENKRITEYYYLNIKRNLF